MMHIFMYDYGVVDRPKMPASKHRKLFTISLFSKHKSLCLLNDEKKLKAMALCE